MKKMTSILFLLSVCTSYSQIVDSNIGAKHIVYIENDSSTPTASDYVQDGLIAIWDGIENKGWGAHDELASSWTELITGVSFPIGGTWEGNVLISDERDLQSSFTSSLVTNLPRTIEFVTDKADIFTTDEYNGLYFYDSDRIYTRGRGTRTTTYFRPSNTYLPTTTYLGSKWGTLSLVSNQTTAEGFINGTYATSGQVDGMTTAKNLFWYRGTRIGCLRFYNRALTAQEIEHNYMIDKARFGL